MTGVVVAQGVDSLTLQVKNGAAYSIVVGHLQHLERYAPQRNGVHALAGLLVGGTLGYFAGAYATNRGTARCEASPGHGDMCGLEALTLPVYTIAGALAGTAVGALLKLPHWEPLL